MKMLWYLPWSESIKKRACRYLLQRYLGNFLEQKLTLDQLSVDLYNGTGTVCDVSLDCEALNDLGDAQNWPLEIVDGHMKKITVTIPWSTLLKDDSVVEVSGLTLTVQPKVRAEPASSMLESMWSSMSSSMQLAAECLRDEDGPQETTPVEGIEMFAHAIDSILSRVKVKFVNTRIRLEHVPKNGDRGIALDIHIEKIDYFDEAGEEPKPEVTDPEKPKTYIESSYTNKKIKFEGVTLYTDEFPSKLRTMARSLIMEKSNSSQIDKSDSSQIDTTEVNFQSTLSDVFYETKSVISTIESEPVKEVDTETIDQTELRDPSPEERSNQPEPLLFAKLNGEQELALKMRHFEEADGPKIEVKMLLGSFLVFITPRQLHTLIELVEAINQPHLEDTSNIPLRPNGGNVQCKPMKRADFQLIEAQLLGNLEKQTTRPRVGMSGWSGPSYESDTESERFLPMVSRGEMAESFTSSISSMNTSMTSSVNLPVTQTRIKRSKKGPRVEGDPTAEISHISLRIESISCVLLHKDILTTVSVGSDCISPASAHALYELSTAFFERLKPYTITDGSKKEFNLANEAIDNATRRNHLRLITSEVTLDGSDKTSVQGNQTLCEASVRHLLLRECLYTQNDNRKPEHYDLIRFDRKDGDENIGKKGSVNPNVKFNFKQTSKYMRMPGEKKLANPTTEVIVKCMPCHLDIELTLIDRMAATFFGGPPSTAQPTTSAPLNQLNMSLQCPNLNAILRFPIADLRPTVNREARRVRTDYLMIKCQNAIIGSQQSPSVRPQPTTYSLKATTLDLFYHENDSLPATHIARTTMTDPSEGNILSGNTTTLLPTISLTFLPTKSNKGAFDDEISFEPTAVNPMTTSMYIMNTLHSALPTPFSKKKMAHQSFTKHGSDENKEAREEQQLIVPGNEEEMSEFTTSAIENSSIHLEFNLPILSLQLESKQIYEIIYNRINSDLLLWEPQPYDPFGINPLMCASIYPAFGGFKTNDTDSDSISSDEENLYYSVYDPKLNKGIDSEKDVEEKDTHNFCLSLKIGKGLLTMYAPVRDSNKRVVPGQMGELILEAHKLSMCQVSGLNGVPKSAQLCLRAGKMTLYHESFLTIPSEKPNLRMYGTCLPSHLKTTIYPSGKGVIIKDKMKTKDMFSLALKIQPDPESANLKTICIALGIEQATLRHRGDKNIAWLTQLMDMIDVLDFPVPGYVPSTIVSELHVHIWDCAVDYRPLYLPIRTVLTLGNFNVSSNVITETNTSCLRFLAQECTLFLMHLHGTKPHVPVPQDDDKMPDINKDYVCVIDVGLFELSIRRAETASSEQPQVDLSASNNMVNLYTCWDSASALCRLLTYAASDGDSQPPFDPSSRHTSICSDQPLEQLIGLEDRPIEEIRELSPNEIQQVNDLMAEALKESPNTTLDEDELNSSTEKEGVEIFFFPDESNMKQKQIDLTDLDAEVKSIEFEEFQTHSGTHEEQDMKLTNAQVAKELGDPTSTPKTTPRKPKRKKVKSSGDGSNTDDEYCIIEAQAAQDNDLAEPIVTWLGQGPTHMYDHHFIEPAVREDVLKAPKSFPMPLYRYNLCEMSVTWTMFGGNDFRPGNELVTVKKTVTIDVDRKQASPLAIKRNTKEYEPCDGRSPGASSASSGSSLPSVSWSAGSERVRTAPSRAPPRTRGRAQLRTRGGPARDHCTCVKLCLRKIKFQHEIYPTGGIHASRQALAISKIEILDRLECSNINKLLSQYKLKDEPERLNAHMLIVKAVHLRPEPALPAQECCLKVSLLPLRFNLDQDTLAFLVGYFSKLGTDESGDDETGSVLSYSSALAEAGSRQTTPTHRPPVMSIASHLRDPPPTPTSLGDADSLSLNDTVIRNEEPLMETYEAERLVSENLIQLEEDFNRLGISQEKPVTKLPVDMEPADDSPIYFRRILFSPEVPVRLDYVGKRVDLSAGPVAGLLMGLGQLNCSELTLKRLDYRLGLLGLEKLVQWALHEWLTDIKSHQLPGLLSGIGPMHSLLQLLTGIRDLVWLPVEQWRRDGRLVHGLRRGAASFTARTAVAALDITTRLLQLIQATAETAFDMLTPGPTLQLQDAYERRERRRRRRQDPSRHPADIREGVATAYQTVKEGFAETAATMALAAREERGAGVLRHLPGCAVAPLALAAAGAADVLGGVRASLAPHQRRDLADKWRSPPPEDTTD